ncbi:embigin isoform X2 [Pteronotus mesoamericanus]|uniref:embigin isoform X2 n=1 Tax=Pteronotus mesoamericanus TaxID=1884717 RepID=UPI0023EDF55B|nr:embigin isoform X2 [Pteronotus parnellii mesoamericanus]
MRALSGLRGPGAPPSRPLLFLCLLAAVRPSLADGQPPAAPFTSLPVREERLARYYNLSLESHNISLTGLTGHSSVAVEKNITLQRPSNIVLVCQFTASGDLNSVNVSWKKDDEPLEKGYSIRAAGGVLYSQYAFTIINSKQMGSYSCFFQEEKKQRGTFNFRVPELHGKNKPLITYVGDSTVLTCKCQGCFPLNWTWYSSNGSVKVPLDVQMDDKYVINGTAVNETRLKLSRLSEDDQGTYWCQAVFLLGESEDRIELVVLSYLVPLKPFLAIAAEVVILVAVILLCEMYTQKKKNRPDDGKEFEQIEQLKSDDSNGIENNVPRHRKNESVASE